jgi:hypothetical protein
MATINESILEARNRGATDEQILLEITNQNPDKTSQFQEAVSRGASPSQIVSEIGEQNKRGFFTRLKQAFGSQETRARARQLETLEGRRGRLDMGDIADVAGGIPSLAGFIGGGALGGLLGGAGGAIAGSAGGAGLGEGVRQAIGGVLGTQERFEPKEVALETAFGAIPGVGGKLLKPFAKVTGKSLGKVGGALGRTFFGVKGESAIKARFADPYGVTKFLSTTRRQPGGAQLSDFEDLVKGGVKSVADASRKAFTQAEDNLVKAVIPRRTVVDQSKYVLRDVLDVPKLTKSSVKTSGASEADVRTINKILDIINTQKDFSTKGIVTMKRRIAKQYKGNQQESKVIVSRLTGSDGVFNRLIGEVDPAFKKALSTFSKDKSFLEKLDVNIIGRGTNVDKTANKLIALAKDLDNPLRREHSQKLIEELERRTGLPLIQTLRALATAETLSPQEAKGVISGLVREMARLLQVGISEVAGVAGKATQTGQRIAPQVSPVVTPATRIGLFEALRGSQQ